jgi:hypothetical protein
MKKLLSVVGAASLLTALPVYAFTTFGTPYSGSQIPVPVYGDETSTLDKCPGLSEYTGTSKRAYLSWNEVPGNTFSWRVGGWNGPIYGIPDGMNGIFFREINDAGVLGQTTFNMYNGQRDSDVKIDLNQNWNCGPEDPWWTQIDMESVILHEVGHQLGLGHSDDPNAVMWWSISMGASRRVPQSDDIAGIQYIY